MEMKESETAANLLQSRAGRLRLEARSSNYFRRRRRH